VPSLRTALLCLLVESSHPWVVSIYYDLPHSTQEMSLQGTLHAVSLWFTHACDPQGCGHCDPQYWSHGTHKSEMLVILWGPGNKSQGTMTSQCTSWKLFEVPYCSLWWTERRLIVTKSGFCWFYYDIHHGADYLPLAYLSFVTSAMELTLAACLPKQLVNPTMVQGWERLQNDTLGHFSLS
jgi:hypothetical protein